MYNQSNQNFNRFNKFPEFELTTAEQLIRAYNIMRDKYPLELIQLFKSGYYDAMNGKTGPRLNLSDVGYWSYELGQWWALGDYPWPEFIK